MGADWIKFKVRPDADMTEVERLSTLVSEQYPHGRWIVTPATFSSDEAVLARWQAALNQLKRLLIFHQGELDKLDYWACTALTDPPGMNPEVVFGKQERAVPRLADIDICRVYVISHNPVFPIEWRDEAYRIILPRELPSFFEKWRTYIEQVREGQWQGYLHELYLFDRLFEEYQLEVFEDIYLTAQASLTQTNAWCRKETLTPIRERILQFNAVGRLKALRQPIPRPLLSDTKRFLGVASEQLEAERQYWELRDACAEQIKEWNRHVPHKRKCRFPRKFTSEEFVARADDTWLKNFLSWCRYLSDEGFGLFLWA
jgi:hypothetical protein